MTHWVTRSDSAQVATITLNRPEVHNAFNEDVIAELTAVFTTLGKDPNVKVVILAAQGASFCAGADLAWMQKMIGYTQDENIEDARALAQMLRAIDECPKPVIAQVAGNAFGGGVGLVSVCDLVVSLESAQFCFSEVKLGLIPAVISPFVLNKIGEASARRYFLTAEPFTAAEAKAMGLVSEVASDADDLTRVTNLWMKRLKANAPEAMGLCKKLLRDIRTVNHDAAVTLATHRIAERRVSPEGQEGLTAFLQKRKPSWIAGDPG